MCLKEYLQISSLDTLSTLSTSIRQFDLSQRGSHQGSVHAELVEAPYFLLAPHMKKQDGPSEAQLLRSNTGSGRTEREIT
jgi:hypothetical protein